METRAVEESFSWTPRSRKTFVREVPLLGGQGNPLEEAKLRRRTLGLVHGFTQRDPRPPQKRWFGRVGVSGEGIKRWGIEESE